MAGKRRANTGPTAWVAELTARMSLPQAPRVTAFRQRVLELLQTVPKGKVTTYKHMAVALDCGSCQAIGQALKNNPFAPVVPCHRVISTSKGIGGFSGFTDPDSAKIKKKVRLLREEGVPFVRSQRTGGWHLDTSKDVMYTFGRAKAGTTVKNHGTQGTLKAAFAKQTAKTIRRSYPPPGAGAGAGAGAQAAHSASAISASLRNEAAIARQSRRAASRTNRTQLAKLDSPSREAHHEAHHCDAKAGSGSGKRKHRG